MQQNDSLADGCQNQAASTMKVLTYGQTTDPTTIIVATPYAPPAHICSTELSSVNSNTFNRQGTPGTKTGQARSHVSDPPARRGAGISSSIWRAGGLALCAKQMAAGWKVLCCPRLNQASAAQGGDPTFERVPSPPGMRTTVVQTVAATARLP